MTKTPMKRVGGLIDFSSTNLNGTHNWRAQTPAARRKQTSDTLPSRRRWPLCMKLVEARRWCLMFESPLWVGLWRPVRHERARHPDQARKTPTIRWPTYSRACRFGSSSTRTHAWKANPLSGNCIHLRNKREDKKAQNYFFSPVHFLIFYSDDGR